MLLSTENKPLELCEEEALDENYEPAEAAAYLRKMMHNAKFNDMTDSLPYSDGDLEELFRAKLAGFPDGIIAACVFVDILSQCLLDETSCALTGAAPTAPAPDPNSYYTIVKNMFPFYGYGENLIKDCCVTVNKLLKIFFRNRIATEKELVFFWDGEHEVLSSRLGRAYGLLAKSFGQNFVPEDFWVSAERIHLAADDIEEASQDVSWEVMAIYVVFALLMFYYSEAMPEKHEILINKCRLMGIDLADHIEKKASVFCKTFGQDPPDPEAAFYRRIADIIGCLVKNNYIGGGLFHRLGLFVLLGYIILP